MSALTAHPADLGRVRHHRAGQGVLDLKKGTTPEMGLAFMKNCKKAGLTVHADFIIGLPGETKETIARTIEYAKELDADTVQVSVAHAYPRTELYEYAVKNGFLATEQRSDGGGHQLPHIVYPGLSLEDMMAGMNTFYDSYYLRPHVVWRIIKKALWDSHERKRLYEEAVEYLRVRAERWKYARNGAQANADSPAAQS